MSETVQKEKTQGEERPFKPRKKKNTRKGKKKHVVEEEDDGPNCFVFRKGRSSSHLKKLVGDFRSLMSPRTATHLKESKKNSLNDFMLVSAQLKVTHYYVFSATSAGNAYLRVSRFPHGPTLIFKIDKYCLQQDVFDSQKNPHTSGSEFNTSPLVVLNNFSSQVGDHWKLASTLLQGSFPAIDINKITVNTCRRVVLWDVNPDTKQIELRQFLIKMVPSGITKGVKRLFQHKLSATIPSLSQYTDISEYIQKENGYTESDAEDEPESKVKMEDAFVGRQRRKLKTKQNAVRLQEIGPRMTLELICVQEGFFQGEDIFGASPLKEESLKKKKTPKEKKDKGDDDSKNKEEDDKDEDDDDEDDDGKKKKKGYVKWEKKKKTTKKDDDDDDDDDGDDDEKGSEADRISRRSSKIGSKALGKRSRSEASFSDKKKKSFSDKKKSFSDKKRGSSSSSSKPKYGKKPPAKRPRH